MKYITVNNELYKIDFFAGMEEGKLTYSIESPHYELQTRRVYYRPERTWNDHLGNAEWGYYVVAKLGNHKKRVYIY